MERVLDKACVLIAAGTLMALDGSVDAVELAMLLVALSSSAFCCLPRLPGKLAYGCAFVPLVLAIANPVAGLCALPFAAYDLACLAGGWPALLCCVALALAHTAGATMVGLLVATGTSSLAAVLAIRTGSMLAERACAHTLRDDLQERLLDLDASRRELVEAQDQEAHAAALAERSRISREIHDNVGHMLTRTIMQLEALEVIHADEPGVQADLRDVSGTVREALDVTRRTVHAMADDAVDLEVELHACAEGSGIDVVRVTYDADGHPDAGIARCLSAIAREALTNAARHGHASSADVRVTEFPALWQIVVTDDGDIPEALLSARAAGTDVTAALARSGMGLRTMWERVDALGGSFRVGADPEFTVFASIPKEHA